MLPWPAGYYPCMGLASGAVLSRPGPPLPLRPHSLFQALRPATNCWALIPGSVTCQLRHCEPMHEMRISFSCLAGAHEAQMGCGRFPQQAPGRSKAGWRQEAEFHPPPQGRGCPDNHWLPSDLVREEVCRAISEGLITSLLESDLRNHPGEVGEPRAGRPIWFQPLSGAALFQAPPFIH